MPFRKLSHNRDMDEAGRNPKRLRFGEQVASSDVPVLKTCR